MNYIVAFKFDDQLCWTFLKNIDNEDGIAEAMRLIGINEYMYQNTLLDKEDCLEKAFYLMRTFEEDYMNEEAAYVDFAEALRSMELGFKVVGPEDKIYCLIDGQFFYYPDPQGKPRHRLPKVRFRSDEILYKEYKVIY